MRHVGVDAIGQRRALFTGAIGTICLPQMVVRSVPSRRACGAISGQGRIPVKTARQNTEETGMKKRMRIR